MFDELPPIMKIRTFLITFQILELLVLRFTGNQIHFMGWALAWLTSASLPEY